MSDVPPFPSISFAELAQRIGCSKNYVWSLFHEPDRIPSLPVAIRIEDALGIPVRAWLDPRWAKKREREREKKQRIRAAMREAA